MQKFHFKPNKSIGINQCGDLIFHNHKKLKTPACWFGLSIIESKEFQLEVFKKANIEAFLSNAYDLYYLDKKNERQLLIKELQKVDLCHKIDSGGFQLMKAKIRGTDGKFPLNPKMVLDKQLEVGCDCGVQLDFPFGPNLNKSQKKRRLNRTLEYLEELVKLVDNYGVDFSFLPVIHTVSNNHNLLLYGLNKIEEILGEKPKILGIGSLVPLVRRGFNKNGMEHFLYTLICIRKMLPDSFIHAFGIGGTMAYLAILTGIDSYDSNGWIQKSAHGVIQLPGISDRFLRKEFHNRPFLIENRKQRNCSKPINEIDIFMKCKCSACLPYYKEDWSERDWSERDWKRKQKDFTGREERPKLFRAIHNVSLYQNEIYEIRNAIQNNSLFKFVQNRLKLSIYYKYIDFIQRLKSKPIEDLTNLDEFLNFEFN